MLFIVHNGQFKNSIKSKKSYDFDNINVWYQNKILMKYMILKS